MHKSIELGGHCRPLSIAPQIIYLSLSLTAQLACRIDHIVHSFVHSVAQALIHSLKHSYICSVLFSSVRLSIMVRYAALESPSPATFSSAQLTDFDLKLLLVCLIFIKSAPWSHCCLLCLPPAVQLATGNLQQQLRASLGKRPSGYTVNLLCDLYYLLPSSIFKSVNLFN